MPTHGRKARKGSEVKPFDPVLSMLGDWWNETISNRELLPVPLPLRLREGSLMKKMNDSTRVWENLIW
jgi:hypothetical protein